MSTVWAIALGILFLATWICVVAYAESIRRVFLLGRYDHRERVDRSNLYVGLAKWSYRRGRKIEAMETNTALKNRLRHTY